MIDREEAHKVARNELGVIERAGYVVASELIDTIILKDVCADSGISYAVELSYLWKDEECAEILVICNITSKEWFRHQQVQESITLCSGIK
jgi:hypothetical protein